MKSRACCKISLPSLRALVKRQPWLSALWFLGFFFSMPVVAAMQLADRTLDMSPADLEWTREFLTMLLSQGHPLLYGIIPMGAFVTVPCLFSYLHSRRQIDFFHSQPIRREQMFAERIVAGLLVMVIPYIINLALTVLVAAVLGFGSCIPWLLMLKGLLWTCGFYLGIFALFLVGSLLAGQSAVNMLISMFLAAVGPALLGLFYACVETFYDNAYTALWNTLSPVAYTNPLARYFVRAELPLVPADALFLLIWGGLALAFCGWLFVKRPSEGAEQALAFPLARLPIKVPLVICATLGLAHLFYLFNGEGFWWYFGGVAGAFLSCQIYEIIYATDFRGARRRVKEFAAVLLLFLAGSAVMWSDATGFNTRLPELEKVASAELLLAGFDDYGYSYRTMPGADRQAVHKRAEYNLMQSPVTSPEAVAAAYSIAEKALAWQQGVRDSETYGYSGSMYDSGVEVSAIDWEKMDPEKRAELTSMPTPKELLFGSVGAELMPVDYVTMAARYGSTTTVGVRFTLDSGKTMQRFYQVGLPLALIAEELAVISRDEAYLAEHFDLFDLATERIRLTSVNTYAPGREEKSQLTEQQQADMSNIPTAQLAELIEVYRGELLALDHSYRAGHMPVGSMYFRYWDADPGRCIFDDKYYSLYWERGSSYGNSFTYPVYDCMQGTIALLDEYYGFDAELFRPDLSTSEYVELVVYASDYYGKSYPLESLSSYQQISIARFYELV
ncbi:MAG: hypothetical protein IKM70_06085, partial [Firmicutes bacterium]|nr:hypothetical protein [Bacillota bacterium]